MSDLPKLLQLMIAVTKCSSDLNANRHVSFVKNLSKEAGEVAQHLRALADPPEDTGSSPRIHVADHKQV